MTSSVQDVNGDPVQPPLPDATPSRWNPPGQDYPGYLPGDRLQWVYGDPHLACMTTVPFATGKLRHYFVWEREVTYKVP